MKRSLVFFLVVGLAVLAWTYYAQIRLARASMDEAFSLGVVSAYKAYGDLAKAGSAPTLEAVEQKASAIRAEASASAR